MAQLAPGVIKGSGNLGNGNLPSFAGASVAENGYYINGFDVTNIRNFLSYANLPFDAIEQQQVKVGGYGAEYGRSLGGVVSLLTKRGTNEWKGGASVYWTPNRLRSRGTDVLDLKPEHADPVTGALAYLSDGSNKVSANRDDDLSFNIYGGGPLIKDKLFVWGLVEGRHDSWDRFEQGRSTHKLSNKPNGILKVDFLPSDAHHLELTAISNQKRTKIRDYHHDADDAEASKYWFADQHVGNSDESLEVSGGTVTIGKYTGYLSDNLTVSALAGRVYDKRAKVTGARVQGLDCVTVWDTTQRPLGCWSGVFLDNPVPDPAAPKDPEDVRTAYRLDLEYILGKHTIRAGYDAQKFVSFDAGGVNYSGGNYYRYFVSNAGTVNGVANAVAPGAQYVRWRIAGSSFGSYEVRNTAWYLEDSWQATPNVLLYGGLRTETFDNKNGDGVSFVKADNLLAPRLGAAWNVNGDSSLKLFANFGRYYIPVASNTNIRATHAEWNYDRYFAFTGKDPVTGAPLGLGAQIGRTIGRSSHSLPDPGSVADTQLKPMSQDELILGLQKALTPQLVGGVKYIHRKVNNGMDDYCSSTGIKQWADDNGFKDFDANSLPSCWIINPGRDMNLKIDANGDGKLVAAHVPASYLGLPEYKRVYDAIELTLEKPFDGKWGLQGSYVWSKLRGTAEGYVQSDLGQEDAGITQDFDFASFMHGADGYLSNDRRHVFKLFGTYALNEQWRVGASAIASSGRPMSCLGFVPESVPDFSGADGRFGSGDYKSASSYYCLNDKGETVLGQRGVAGRTPWTYKLDLQVAYTPKLGAGKLTLQVDVFNVLNSQRVERWSQTRDKGRADVGELNLNYRQPTGFQDPRAVRLTARYEF